MSGFAKRAVHLVTDAETTITVEIDAEGNGDWTKLAEVPVHGYRWLKFDESLDATWVRLRSSAPLKKASAWFHFASFAEDEGRDAAETPAKFAGIAKPGEKSITGGLVRARDKNRRTLQFAATNADGKIGNLHSRRQDESQGGRRRSGLELAPEKRRDPFAKWCA